MTGNYNIIIKNMSSTTTSFYLFQYQSTFSMAGSAATATSSSLAYGTLSPNALSGSQLTFSLSSQVYAGAISNSTTSYGMMQSANYMVEIQENSGQSSAIEPIDLTPTTGAESANNCSNLSVSPLGLSTPYHQSGPPAGSFAIKTPSYTPSAALSLYVGNAAINQNGAIILSSFITPAPSTQIYCAPKPIFFVKVGVEEPGQPITYDLTNSAQCDFTTGYTTISVSYAANGTFSTSGS